MSESSSFFLLDERIQRFIWAEGWTELRDAQEQAIPLIIDAKRDVIIAAATAAGKTEAAFLPALTYHLKQPPEGGLIVYISPLKALINDQFGRLDKLCEDLRVPVWPWHGDISANRKARFMARPSGVLLITPESVEAFMCNRGTAIGTIFSGVEYFIVDELHAFLGTERGKQLQSLLHRIETVLGRSVPRIALSATLGNMRLAAEFLRPGHGDSVTIVDSKAAHAELKVALKGFEEPPPPAGEEDCEPVAPGRVAEDLFKCLRGTNNLVFPNSRREVERYTHLLSEMCAKAQVPNEFWPHHGSLSKEIRADTEAALKQNIDPATAICTNTLELGIDIGAVKSVAQIGPAPSVASLRQRLGRSGRRKGEAAVLRGYCIEDEVTSDANLFDRLRLNTVQQAAMVSLLGEGWYEPPIAHGAHLSTLVQQLLSLIAQNGGVTPGEAYKTLMTSGAPFEGLSAEEFKDLLRQLGQRDLLAQDGTGLLLHGPKGERFVNHYSFYAAFAADEEFRIVAGERTLGSLPVSQMLRVGQHILFAGKTWSVEEIRQTEKTIYVLQAKGGVPPLFSGGGGRVHTRVRQRMREVLASESPLAFLDATASRFLAEGRTAYQQLDLAKRVLLDQGSQALVMTWLGDAPNEAIACLLTRRGMQAWPAGPAVEVIRKDLSLQDIEDALADAAVDDVPPLAMLLEGAKNLEREKWDWTLPPQLLQKAYGSLYLDVDEALSWLRTIYVTHDEVQHA